MKKLYYDKEIGKIIYCHDEDNNQYLGTIDEYKETQLGDVPLYLCAQVGNVLTPYGHVVVDGLDNVIEAENEATFH